MSRSIIASLPEHTLIESGVDWITCTGREGETARALLRVGQRLLEEERLLGNDIKTWRHKMYEGWCCGGVDIGQRVDGSIVRLRSNFARENWWDVFQEASNCSRLDLQVTARFNDVDPSRIVNRCWAMVRKRKARGKKQEWHMRRDSSKGDTLECGRRVSDRFGRVYDKRRQSRLDYYEGCARFEMQANNETALNYARGLAHATSSYEAAIEYVREFFSTRGIVLALALHPQPPIGSPRRASDLDRWLTWARIGVQPRVKQAIARGKLPELLEVLGLHNLVRPTDVVDEPGPPGPIEEEETNGSL